MSKKKKRPTIIDVAEQAGVSISTVSRVLNASATVNDAKAEKVRQAIEELKYQPKAAARILASQKTETIGLLLPFISGDYFAGLLRGVERGAMEGGYDLLIHSTNNNIRPDSPYRRVLGEHNTDGVIVFSDSLDEKGLSRFAEGNFPTILLHRASPPNLEIPSVTVENKNGVKKIVEHLVQAHNRRKIVLLRGPQKNEDSYWREMGYRKALEENNIPFDPTLVGTGNFNSYDAQASIENLIEVGVAFDAVFAGNDEAAAGVLKTLRFAGLQVPEQVAVVGFNNANLAQYLTPSLTTVDAQVEQAGFVAAQKLLQLIQYGCTDKITLLPTQPILRHSCGCGYREVQTRDLVQD